MSKKKCTVSIASKGKLLVRIHHIFGRSIKRRNVDHRSDVLHFQNTIFCCLYYNFENNACGCFMNHRVFKRLARQSDRTNGVEVSYQ